MFKSRVSKESAYWEHNSTIWIENAISNDDKQICRCIPFLHKHYEQSGAALDFVSTYEKIRATKILINAEIHTQLQSAHVSWIKPIK